MMTEKITREWVKVSAKTEISDLDLIEGHAYCLHIQTRRGKGFVVGVWCEDAFSIKDRTILTHFKILGYLYVEPEKEAGG